LRGHDLEVNTAVFSHPGRRVLTSSMDTTARLWRWRKGTAERCMHHPAPVNFAEISADGRIVATACDDGLCRIWPIKFKSKWGVRKLAGHKGAVMSVCLSRDGGTAVTCGEDKTCRMWRTETGVCMQVMKSHGNVVHKGQMSRGDSQLTTASSDGTVRIWRLDRGSCVKVLRGHAGPVFSASFGHDNMLVVSCGIDGTARVWDIITGQCLQVMEHENNCLVCCAVFSKDDQLVLTSGTDKSVRIWIRGDALQDVDADAPRVIAGSRELHFPKRPGDQREEEEGEETERSRKHNREEDVPGVSELADAMDLRRRRSRIIQRSDETLNRLDLDQLAVNWYSERRYTPRIEYYTRLQMLKHEGGGDESDLDRAMLEGEGATSCLSDYEA